MGSGNVQCSVLAQAHLRHTDPRLTANTYTDERVLPVAAAIANLPWLESAPMVEPEALKMTGTDACDIAQRTRRTLARIIRRDYVEHDLRVR
jgi:hypothetical protein